MRAIRKNNLPEDNPLSTDLEWMLQSRQAGQDLLVETLIREYYASLYGLALQWMNDRGAAAGAVQEAITRAALDAGRYQPSLTAETWLYRGALEVFKRAHAWLKLRRFWKAFLPNRVRPADLGASQPASKMDASLWPAVDGLDGAERAAVLLTYTHDWPLEKTAAVLKISKEEMKSRLDGAHQNILSAARGAGMPANGLVQDQETYSGTGAVGADGVRPFACDEESPVGGRRPPLPAPEGLEAALRASLHRRWPEAALPPLELNLISAGIQSRVGKRDGRRKKAVPCPPRPASNPTVPLASRAAAPGLTTSYPGVDVYPPPPATLSASEVYLFEQARRKTETSLAAAATSGAVTNTAQRMAAAATAEAWRSTLYPLPSGETCLIDRLNRISIRIPPGWDARTEDQSTMLVNYDLHTRWGGSGFQPGEMKVTIQRFDLEAGQTLEQWLEERVDQIQTSPVVSTTVTGPTVYQLGDTSGYPLYSQSYGEPAQEIILPDGDSPLSISLLPADSSSVPEALSILESMDFSGSVTCKDNTSTATVEIIYPSEPLDRKSPESLLAWLEYGLELDDISLFNQIAHETIYYGPYESEPAGKYSKEQFLLEIEKRLPNRPEAVTYVYHSGEITTLYVYTKGWEPEWDFGRDFISGCAVFRFSEVMQIHPILTLRA